MMLKDRLERLGAVAAHLPFHVEDLEAANGTFVRWWEGRSDADLKTVEVWLYCYTQRYVLLRLLREARVAPSDVDRLIEVVFLRARDGLGQVDEPARFTHWVNVVCRNAYLNGRRRSTPFTPLDETTLSDPGGAPQVDVETAYDRDVIRRVVRQAVERLPSALRPIAALRLLEGRSYRHIAAVTDRPLPTVRTYVAKAMNRLRQDPDLRALLFPDNEKAGTQTGETPPPFPANRRR